MNYESFLRLKELIRELGFALEGTAGSCEFTHLEEEALRLVDFLEREGN